MGSQLYRPPIIGSRLLPLARTASRTPCESRGLGKRLDFPPSSSDRGSDVIAALLWRGGDARKKGLLTTGLLQGDPLRACGRAVRRLFRRGPRASGIPTSLTGLPPKGRGGSLRAALASPATSGALRLFLGPTGCHHGASGAVGRRSGLPRRLERLDTGRSA